MTNNKFDRVAIEDKITSILGGPWELKKSVYSLQDSYSNEEQAFWVMNYDKKQVAYFSLETFPANCATWISVHSYVRYQFRNMGLGTLLNRWRIAYAKENNISLLLATVSLYNKPEQKVLEKVGWKCLEKFFNPTYRNWNYLYSYNIPIKL